MFSMTLHVVQWFALAVFVLALVNDWRKVWF